MVHGQHGAPTGFAGILSIYRRPETSGFFSPRLEVKNLEVDVVPFSAAINACAKGQEWLPALLLLSELNTVSCGICHVNRQTLEQHQVIACYLLLAYGTDTSGEHDNNMKQHIA